ncbi:45874_t:CDS:1, partial [Gigaspora margarita]
LQTREDLSENKVFGPLKKIFISSDKMSKFEIVQESFVDRLEAIILQKVENNKKTKRSYDNTTEEYTESGRIDLGMQIDSMTSAEQNNKTVESHDASMISSRTRATYKKVRVPQKMTKLCNK